MGRFFTRAANDDLHVAFTPVTGPPLTMACWAKVTNIVDMQALVCIASSTDASQYFLLAAAGNQTAHPVRVETLAGTSVQALTTVGYQANTWFHACGVFTSASSRSVYLNGGSVGVDANTRAPVGLNQISIGRIVNPASGATVDGIIAEVGIWNVAISVPSLTRLAAGTSPLDVEPNSLAFYAPLLGRYSPEIEVRGGRNLTVVGATRGDHPPVRGRRGVYVASPASLSPTTTPSATSVVNGRLQIVTPDGQTGYGGLRSSSVYDLTNSYVGAELTSAGGVTATPDRETFVAAVMDANNEVRLRVVGTLLEARTKVAGTWATVFSTTYNAATHYALRLREATGTTYWEARPAAGTWVTLFSQANAIALTNLEIQVAAGNINSSTTTTVTWDNVNIEPVAAEEDTMLLLGVE